jgi:hypothetical protein
MRIAIAGSSGFLGSALRASLDKDGHEIVRLVRRAPSAPNEVQWDPYQQLLDPAKLDGVEAVVNLCGVSTGARRWTRRLKKEIYQSRVHSTQVLANTLATMTNPPRVFVSASGIGYYGPDRRREFLDEDSAPGNGFMSGLCVDWEAAARPASDAGVAVVHPRMGIVIDQSGGALERLLPFFRRGLGGSLSRGDQFWSLISLSDAIRALRFLIDEHGNVGPYNVTNTEPVTNGEFSRTLGKQLSRPVLIHVPAPVLHAMLNDFAEDLLGSLRVLPKRLSEAGFEFDHPEVESVVAAALK